MSDALDYEALVAAFEHSLLTQLRGHSAAAPFLEVWVPDEDPVRALQNMFEAAEISGERRLAVTIAAASLPSARLAELTGIAEEFGTLTVTAQGDRWLLELDEIGLGQLLHRVAPAYRAALRDRLGHFAHAGWLEAPLAATRLLTVEQDGFTLTVLVDGGSAVILDACHDGPDDPVNRAVLDHFCDVLRGLPVQEASDHAGHHLVARLTAADAARPVAGIVLPDNADPLFRLPKAMARKLLVEWRELTGYLGRENEFTTAPESDWAKLAAPARAAAVQALLESGDVAAGVPAGGLRLATMEPNIQGYEVRAIVAFAATVAPEDKPGLARRGELLLKRRLDPHIELYVEELKDQNAIRRL